MTRVTLLEAITVKLLRTPTGDRFSAIRDGESTPPLYYVLAWLCRTCSGTPSSPCARSETAEIDAVRFLLDIQGQSRRGRAPDAPEGFRAGRARRWPGLEVVRYTAPSPRAVRLTGPMYVVPAA